MRTGVNSREEPDEPPDRAERGVRVTDGGVVSSRPPIENSRTYSEVLATLGELDRQFSSDSLDRGRAVQAVRQFVSMEYHGGGYVSGLTIAARLLLHAEVTTEEVPAGQIDREPYDELVAWVLDANDPAADASLSDETFEFCLDRPELRELLLDAVERDEGAVDLTDEQVVSLSESPTPPCEAVTTVAALADRDLVDDAREAMGRYFESQTDRTESVHLLRRTADLGLTEDYRERLRASLNRWRPEEGVDRLASLADLGRSEGLYAELLLAVKRWLRTTDDEAVPPERRGLVAAAVEALLRGDRTGREDAVILYRDHLYASSDLYGIGADVFEAATETGEDAVATDVLEAYDTESFVPSESDAETAKMAAQAAEHDSRWDEAFEIWSHQLEASPSRDLFERAIENRLTVGDLEAAADFTERFDQEVDATAAPVAYRVRIADKRGDYRRVVDAVESNDGVFAVDSVGVGRVATAYVQALADLGRWDALVAFLDDTDRIDTNVHRFYERVAKLMQFATEADDSMDGTTAIDVAERLLAAPMQLEELQLLLNLGVTRQVADRIRSEFPEDNDRLDVVEGLVEILVSLHAERLIDELHARGTNTDEFEQMLAETDLRRGGRQLLSTLEREARREGITEAL